MMRGNVLFRIAAIALSIGLSETGAVSAQVNMLYATKIPNGSSFVRVVNGSSTSTTITIGASDPVTLSAAGTVVSSYHLIAGGRSLPITIDGKQTTSVMIPANKYLTLIYRPGTSGPQLTTITDNPGDDTGLLAELRFYNLVPGCEASLSLENGPAVFDGVGADQSKSRSINPVAATLIPKCGSSAGTPVKLPLLKAQARYSVFLVGSDAKPAAVGNADATDNAK